MFRQIQILWCKMINITNLKKTWYYLQKNGIADTYYAVRERFFAKNSALYPDKNYHFEPISDAELERQKKVPFTNKYRFSILVPMYETKPEFARAMINSVLIQTYPDWELILADASKSNLVQDTVASYTDKRIRYYRLAGNGGISENTNAALGLATGDYIGLLDHDDFLTPNALFEMASCLDCAAKEGKTAAFIYSDEDKCDTNGEKYYEPNIKPGFNFELLLSNNYICHFLVMKAELMKKLQFRSEYDGAQDFDLVLRAALHKGEKEEILHIEKVLYHWRCHEASTAANPRSKQYAYEAGKRAVMDALKVFLGKMHEEDLQTMQAEGTEKMMAPDDVIRVKGIPVHVAHTKHNGFYRVVYGRENAEDIFAVRKDIGIIAGSIKKKQKITGGIKKEDGSCSYAGLHAKFSGYLHRNILQQGCKWVDLGNAAIRSELMQKIGEKEKLNLNLSEKSERICEEARKEGYTILYDPLFEKI